MDLKFQKNRTNITSPQFEDYGSFTNPLEDYTKQPTMNSSTTKVPEIIYTLSAEEEFICTFLVGKIFKVLITVIGLIGNILTIIILSKRRNIKSSTAVYLNALAISDILILIFGPFCDWLEDMLEVIISNYGQFACKLQTFLQYSSSSTSSWLLVAVTIERAISVTMPHRVRSSCTTRVAIIVVIVTWIVVYFANLHFLFGMGHTHNKLCKAVASLQYIHFSKFVLPWVDFCVCFACPGILLLLGNIVIIFQLAQYHSRQKHLANGPSSASCSVSIILIVVNFVFLITTGPIYIYSIMLPYLVSTLEPADVVSLQSFWGPMLNSLWETNAALNMVLYVLTGSRFRVELGRLLCCKKSFNPLTQGIFDSRQVINRIYKRSPVLRCTSNTSAPSELNVELLPYTNRIF